MSRANLALCAVAAAAVMAATGLRAEEPYVASVGADDGIKKFYIAPQLYQFTHQTAATDGAESFSFGRGVSEAPEVCNLDFDGGSLNVENEVNSNWMITRGSESHFQWVIRLPKKPAGNLTVALQCGVLKPNSVFLFDRAVSYCAGEEGEFADVNCTRRLDEPGISGVAPNRYLPKLAVSAIAEGTDPNAPPAGLVPFNLTSYRNPGDHAFTLASPDGGLVDSRSMQVLNGSAGSSIIMKACMAKTIVLKMPVTGQLNAAGQTEFDLEAGDLISVRLDLPRGHTMDVFCNRDSVKVMGIGAPSFFSERAVPEDFTVLVAPPS